MKKVISILFALTMLSSAVNLSAITLKRVSVHDPSIVWNGLGFYVFGTHRGMASTSNMMSWNTQSYTFGVENANGTVTTKQNTGSGFSQFFKTNMTKTVTIGGVEKTFGNFDAFAWSNATIANYNIDGNMWAPDVIYNKKMEKWCLYFSINGENWGSSIVLLTADKITGPYTYQGPVVFSGFHNKSIAARSYKNTDLELVVGTQSSLPSRYDRGDSWGSRWPHAIDPCVFYDEDGKLWMSYGSWSGGIWMLQLNEDNGLRDYDVKYASTGGTTDGVTSDPYFGKKIAGGYYVSGEGSYIEYINGYYYLFVTYGFMLSAENGTNDQKNQGGYQMRVFRSTNPDGPYVDNRSNSAVFPKYIMNYGTKDTEHRGTNIFGAYSEWGNMSLGEREQGHNSIIAAEDGRTYLVYHTRFQDNTQGHALRVHQVFQNQDGWLVAAPFEYTGEKVTSADIATTQQIALSEIPGVYQLLIHKYQLNYIWGNQETVTPIEITLKADGTISGARTGKWESVTGTSYVNLNIGGVQYRGVMVEQTMEEGTSKMSTTFTGKKVAAFTALSNSGTTVWGYRSGDDPTGINEISLPDYQESVMFDLQGRRIDKPVNKGIYIGNGAKRVVR